MLRVRLLDQMEWAAEYGALDEVDRLLRGLAAAEWFQGDDVPVATGSKVNEVETLLPAAIAAVTECAAQMLAEATQLQERLQTLRLPALQAEEVPALALTLDAEAVGALADLVELSGRLEKAAETDGRCEPAFALVIEAAGRLLQGFQKAQAATQALRTATTRVRRAALERVAADGSVVVLEVGAEGGSLTLIGREGEDGAWRFARITIDQTEALFGETDVEISPPPALQPGDWVEGWEAGLQLMDRYPWAQLHAVYVHPEFVARVRVAVEERLHGIDTSNAQYAAEKWERLFRRVTAGD